ncbi:hypothetical protein B0H14DRAFT_2797948, partial [Mycena olivaceomarginata]
MRRREGRGRRGRRRGVWMRTMMTMGTRWRMTQTMIAHLRGAAPAPRKRANASHKKAAAASAPAPAPAAAASSMPTPPASMASPAVTNANNAVDVLHATCAFLRRASTTMSSCCDTATHTSTSSSSQSFRPRPSVSTPLPTSASTIPQARVLDRVRLVSPLLRAVLAAAPNIQHLSLSSPPGIGTGLSAATLPVFPPLPRLQSLVLLPLTPFCVHAILHATNLAQLTHLIIVPAHLQWPAFPVLPALRTLTLFDDRVPAAFTFPAILALLPALAALHYSPAPLSATDAPPPPDARV